MAYDGSNHKGPLLIAAKAYDIARIKENIGKLHQTVFNLNSTFYMKPNYWTISVWLRQHTNAKTMMAKSMRRNIINRKVGYLFISHQFL